MLLWSRRQLISFQFNLFSQRFGKKNPTPNNKNLTPETQWCYCDIYTKEVKADLKAVLTITSILLSSVSVWAKTLEETCSFYISMSRSGSCLWFNVSSHNGSLYVLPRDHYYFSLCSGCSREIPLRWENAYLTNPVIPACAVGELCVNSYPIPPSIIADVSVEQVSFRKLN